MRKLLAKLLIASHLRPQVRVDRIARGQGDESKYQHRDPEENGDRDEDSPRDIRCQGSGVILREERPKDPTYGRGLRGILRYAQDDMYLR